MIEDGVMDRVVNCFGLHVNSKFEAHHIHYSPGPCKAACDFWEINILGL